LGGRKGRLIQLLDRRQAVALIKAAVSKGARIQKACETLDISIRTFERWQTPTGDIKQDGRLEHGRAPANKLTEEEIQGILSCLNSARFRDCAPHQIVPRLADDGIYIGSESSFYRVLNSYGLNTHRGRAKKANCKKPKPHVAYKPNKLWSWDITYLPRDVKGLFFYLYFIVDVFSRKIVGFEVYESESSEYAAIVAKAAYESEQINGKNINLHSDNGSPMKGGTMLSMLQALGVIPSFSRPSVSNDNPYSESLFKTLKYCPQYPSTPFKSLGSARAWVKQFVQWYNHEHCHSGIKYVTPEARHTGADKMILANRKLVYECAKAKHPTRWSGKSRNWDYIEEVYLNPGKPIKLKVA